jgi:hypothetical protein
MMEFGEAVIFGKFLREYGYAADKHKLYVNIRDRTPKVIEQENPGLWFKWLAYRAVYFNKPTGDK